MAIGLGGDTPQRRIQLASHHFDAGNPGRARSLLEETIATVGHGVLRAEASNLLGVVHIFGDSLVEAADVLRAALDDVGDDLALRVEVLVAMSFALLNVGDLAAAVSSAEDAATNAERLGRPYPLSQALGMRSMVRFLAGEGVDQASLDRALALEDRHPRMPVAFRPSMQNAMMLAWTGELQRSTEEMNSIARRCMERGEDSEWMFVAFNSLITHVWRGMFTEATAVAEDAMERALQMGGDVMLAAASSMRATLAIYAGRVEDARAAVGEALAASLRAGSSILAGCALTIGGFVELSVADYHATLSTLGPLLSIVDKTPRATEYFFVSTVSDAAEAMICLGRLDEAEPLIDALEGNGRRLDRAWLLAVGGRCRAMLLAARGDVTAASDAAERAMVQHDRLPMPFERARTQLLVGQLQRRQRRNNDAANTLGEALATFENLCTPLWADRVRAELGRANVGPHSATTLTASEQRVAELAAAGKTNRDVAAALFISPKTVEANLARIYRKLGIHSRAELGQRMRTEP